MRCFALAFSNVHKKRNEHDNLLHVCFFNSMSWVQASMIEKNKERGKEEKVAARAMTKKPIDKHEKLLDTPFLGYRLRSTQSLFRCGHAHALLLFLSLSECTSTRRQLISLQGKRSINFNELFQMRWNQLSLRPFIKRNNRFKLYKSRDERVYIYTYWTEHKRKGEQEIEKVMFGMIATNCSSVHETFHLNVMKIERCVYTLIQSDCVAKVVCNL